MIPIGIQGEVKASKFTEAQFVGRESMSDICI